MADFTYASPPTETREIQRRKYCLEMANTLQPKDAGDLIKKAAGIYNWLMRSETPND